VLPIDQPSDEGWNVLGVTTPGFQLRIDDNVSLFLVESPIKTMMVDSTILASSTPAHRKQSTSKILGIGHKEEEPEQKSASWGPRISDMMSPDMSFSAMEMDGTNDQFKGTSAILQSVLYYYKNHQKV
jgi:hypothetical protein